MEPSAQEIQDTNPWNRVTPLSKYLAMVLFILMPFIGGWIGYTYAPEKTIEIERIVYRDREIQTSTTTSSTASSTTVSMTPYEAWEQREKRIAELKANPSLKIDDIYDLHSVVPYEETKEIYESARKYVTENSAEEMSFNLVFVWKKGDWIHFTIIPENIETDFTQLYMHREAGEWTLKGFGTAFPDLYEKHPELFDE